MNGRQELLRVISLFDVTKLDLPSFNLSMSKFDEVAHAYSKVMLLASIVTLEEPDEGEESKKRREVAISTIAKLVANPRAYCYEECSRSEQKIINQAADDIWGHLPASKKVCQIKEKAKQGLMIKNLKSIISCLKTVEQTYPDVLLDRYMDDAVFYDVLEKFRSKSVQAVEKNHDDALPMEDATPTEEACTEEQVENCEVKFGDDSAKKTSFWGKVVSIFKKP
jgi:hypothetical protein